jgi:arylsulfatase A-like enzyme
MILAFAAGELCARDAARHVILVVWDGMRPDFVRPDTAPVLFTLAQSGVTFDRHHSVFVTSTEVNGTALATGMYPEQSGVIANSEFRPAIQPAKPIMTADLDAVRKGDELTHNRFLAAPTLAEILHEHGLATAIAGAKRVTLLQDRHAGSTSALGVNLFEGKTLPESLALRLQFDLGRFPPAGIPKVERDVWTTRALIGPLWEKELPAFSMLWLSEPDNAQHDLGPGTATALRAIRSSDANLGRVLAALEQRGELARTDVIVVSDHAFSTVSQKFDIARQLKHNGFEARRKFRASGPREGEILVVGNGSTIFFYVAHHEPAVISAVVYWLQAQPYTGVLFTRERLEGTFGLEAARINSPDAPDVVLSMRWSSEPSATGAPGMVCSDCSGWFTYGCGHGIHSSLSPYDLHNTGIAAGPDFRKGFHDNLPTGNIDIMPTILWILGIKPPQKTSGRVLREALAGEAAPAPAVTSRQLEAAAMHADFRWRQALAFSEVEGVIYLEQGRGQQESW